MQVQKRVGDLIRVIDSLLVEMQTRGSHWTGFLDKLAVINMAYTQVGRVGGVPLKAHNSCITHSSQAAHPNVGLFAAADHAGAALIAAAVHCLPKVCGQPRH